MVRITGFELENWSGARDLNPGPHGPEPCALPNCASPRRESDSIGALRQTLTDSTCGREVRDGRTSLGNRLPVIEREPAGRHHSLPERLEPGAPPPVLLPLPPPPPAAPVPS